MGCTNSTMQKQSVAQPASSPPATSEPAPPQSATQSQDNKDATKGSMPEAAKATQPQVDHDATKGATSEATQAPVPEADKADSAEKAASPNVDSDAGVATEPHAHAPLVAPVVRSSAPPAASKHTGDFRKQRTVLVDQEDLELMVTNYSCHDATMLSSLGKHCKESTWRVQVGLHTEPVEIKVNVDATPILRSPAVSITSRKVPSCGTQASESTRLFPTEGTQGAKLREDFQNTWPFRGSVAGVGEAGRYQVRLPSLVRELGQSEWFPAILLHQRSDGQLKVQASVPDAKGKVQAMEFPAIKASDIRLTGSNAPLIIPEATLVLNVPAADPLMAMLSAGGTGEPFTANFARPSPADGKRETVEFVVSKKRESVSANVGFNAFSALHSHKAFSVPCDNATNQKRAWTVRFGPNPKASHTIQIERKHRVGADSRVITLTVDEEVLVDAAADDMKIEEAAGKWVCNFRFIAEKVFDFQVHECNVDGEAFEQTVIIPQVHKSTHLCTVSIPDERNFHTAQFFVDGLEFHSMDPYTAPHEEEPLSMPLHAFEQDFDIHVPTAMNSSLPAMSNLFDFDAPVADLPKEMQLKVLPVNEARNKACGMFSSLLRACNEGSPSAPPVEASRQQL